MEEARRGHKSIRKLYVSRQIRLCVEDELPRASLVSKLWDQDKKPHKFKGLTTSAPRMRL